MPGEPRTIGRYEVQHELGHGAMGVVYLAFDPLLKRPLAIKTVRDLGGDIEATLARFQREAEVSARLNHPNIVTVHDVGQDPQAGPFLAMEFVDGAPLSDLIRQGIPAETVVHLLLQGMSALQAAERAGITHRDVKPANILVSHSGRLKLMDFGIARGGGTRLTQTGQIIGTPSYTAPEALAGAQPSSVTDRYAFAVTAFQMLTSELPFECSTIAATLFRIVHEPPLFPDNMDPALRAVFEKALAKDPADRYPDLSSFMTDLITALDLPAEARTKYLAAMARDAGADVARLIRGRGDEAVAVDRNMETMATPSPSRSIPREVREKATEAFRTPRPGTPWPGTVKMPAGTGAAPADPAQRPTVVLPAPDAATQVLPAPAGSVLRFLGLPWGWRGWTAAGVLAAGLAFGAVAWGLHARAFLLDVASTPEGATILLDGREIGHTDMTGARIPGGGATLRLELAGYAPQELRVRKGDAPLRVVLAPAPFTVQVVTDPPGAEALLNGVPQGRTPLKNLQVPGNSSQELVLRLKDYMEWTQTLDKETPLPVVIKLDPLTTSVRINTNPPGAEVLINGNRVGVTPIPKVAIPTEGEQRLVLRLKNHQEWQGVLRPGRGLPDPIFLAPLAAGIKVRTEPAGGTVYLDGRKVGVAPLANLPVPATGTHTLRVTREGYEDWSATLDPARPLPDPIVLSRARKPGSPAPAAAPAPARTEPEQEAQKKGGAARGTATKAPAPAENRAVETNKH